MDAEVDAILAEMSSIKERSRAVVRKLGDDGVRWKPAMPDTSSAAQLISHMFGGERSAVHGRIGGEAVTRDRDQEFSNPVSTVEGLLKVIDEAEAGTKRVLANETAQSLARELPANQPGTTTTAQKTLVHVVAHQAEHLGHMELTAQMRESSR